MNPHFKFDHQQYQRLFCVQGLRFLITDIWMGFYRQKQTLVIFDSDHFTSYLSKQVLVQTLQEGVELFSNSSHFTLYRTEFLEYIQRAEKRGNELALKNALTIEECQEFFNLLSTLFVYYSKTEFFYTDEAYRQSRDNEVLRENLKLHGELKNFAREMLNKMFFGEEGYLNRILRTLSRQFSVRVEELSDYLRAEICELFLGKKVEQEKLCERSCFIFLGIDQEVIIETGKEARTIAQRFAEEKMEIIEKVEQIKGVIANTGKVRGKVKIIKAGYDNYDQLQAIIAEMNKGDILLSETTSPDLMVACMKAAAIVTDQGGMLSHAAIVSRELGIPCIVGTGHVTKVFSDGEMVEVDAIEGIVRRVE